MRHPKYPEGCGDKMKHIWMMQKRQRRLWRKRHAIVKGRWASFDAGRTFFRRGGDYGTDIRLDWNRETETLWRAGQFNVVPGARIVRSFDELMTLKDLRGIDLNKWIISPY